eukprot:CCRYP_011007-RA/>CCRYP_011007-RA protein AED:0.41 eAED:0.52 QI:0/0/0/1/0/0/2/0/96
MTMEANLNFTLKPYETHMHNPTSIKNSKANAILKWMHQVIMTMLCTAELDMANTVAPSDVVDFLTDARCCMGRSLHIPHYTQSLSRRSNIWQGHAV